MFKSSELRAAYFVQVYSLPCDILTLVGCHYLQLFYPTFPEYHCRGRGGSDAFTRGRILYGS